MIRSKSNIISVDLGINGKKNGKLLQQCATQFSVLFRLIPRSTEKIYDSFLIASMSTKPVPKYQKENMSATFLNIYSYLIVKETASSTWLITMLTSQNIYT